MLDEIRNYDVKLVQTMLQDNSGFKAVKLKTRKNASNDWCQKQ